MSNYSSNHLSSYDLSTRLVPRNTSLRLKRSQWEALHHFLAAQLPLDPYTPFEELEQAAGLQLLAKLSKKVEHLASSGTSNTAYRALKLTPVEKSVLVFEIAAYRVALEKLEPEEDPAKKEAATACYHALLQPILNQFDALAVHQNNLTSSEVLRNL